jgi:hypothetical protein
MKIAVTGLQNSGKTTVFNALTGLNLPATPYPSVVEEPGIGVVRVPDQRVKYLASLYKPRKTTYSTVEYIDYNGLIPGDLEHNKKVFDLILNSDAVVRVVRAFDDEAIAHPGGGVDPKRDGGFIETESLLFDLELVEKRLTRMDESVKRGKEINAGERKTLLRCRDALEEEIPLRKLDLSEEEMRSIGHLQFLSMKPVITVLNVSEKDVGIVTVVDPVDSAAGGKDGMDGVVVSLSAKIEMEIAQLPHDDALEFMEDLGIEEPALNRLIRVSYGMLGLISFFTVGSDEVKAWTIRDGTIAREAAGKIHSDIERGFIRAETVAYDDFRSAGSMAEARKRGLLRLEGKTYQVRDGDIIDFRFNV